MDEEYEKFRNAEGSTQRKEGNTDVENFMQAFREYVDTVPIWETEEEAERFLMQE